MSNLTDIRPQRSLTALVEKIPVESMRWIARAHLDYLDGKFYNIERLTHYLATCRHVERQRVEYVRFVDFGLFHSDLSLGQYLDDFAVRYWHTRDVVLSQCDEILEGSYLQSRESMLEFWRRFALENELDSLHGMFLTSGRWYTNVMLPAVKRLALGFLYSVEKPSHVVDDSEIDRLAIGLAMATITPQFQLPELAPPREIVSRFARILREALLAVDGEVVSLFYDLARVPFNDAWSLGYFVDVVSRNPSAYEEMLNSGVYPPFAWHEIRGAKREPRTSKGTMLPDRLVEDPMWQDGFVHLRKLKRFEADYNTFNYKGYFCLVSRYMYLRTLDEVPSDLRQRFLDAILGDRFFDALEVLEEAWG